MHLPYEVLETRLRELPPPPTDEGTVVLVVARPQPEARRTPQVANLTADAGVEGDRWGNKLRPDPESQITVMRADVAKLFADGQPLSRFGDNLLVDLDISAVNLPPGARLRIGSALCEVTPKPHTGCGKFAARFGQDARDIANSKDFETWRLRGLHVRVLEPGQVSPGDTIRVLSRG
jgi:MOSC domain-containing protein YiiM